MKWRGVSGGTPLHGKSLCDTCSNAHIVKGAADSQRSVVCEAVYYRPQVVPFATVVECSHYNDITKSSLYDMKKMAYVLVTDKLGKPMGFKQNNDFRRDEGYEKDDDIAPGQKD